MGCGHVLDLAKLAFLIHLLNEQVLAAVYDRFRHHVPEPSISDELANLIAFRNSRRHGNRAHHVLARLQGSHAHPSVVWNRRVDVDEVDFRIF